MIQNDTVSQSGLNTIKNHEILRKFLGFWELSLDGYPLSHFLVLAIPNR